MQSTSFEISDWMNHDVVSIQATTNQLSIVSRHSTIPFIFLRCHFITTLQIRDLNLGEAPSFLRSRGAKTGEEAESKWPSEEKSCPLAQCPQSLVIKN